MGYILIPIGCIAIWISAFFKETIYRLTAERISHGFFALSIILVIITLGQLISNTKITKITNKVLSFFGKMSLELYLTHNFAKEVFLIKGKLSLRLYAIIIVFSIFISIILAKLRKKLVEYKRKELEWQFLINLKEK